MTEVVEIKQEVVEKLEGSINEGSIGEGTVRHDDLLEEDEREFRELDVG